MAFANNFLTTPLSVVADSAGCNNTKILDTLECESDRPPLKESDFNTFMLRYDSAKDVPAKIKSFVPGGEIDGNAVGSVKLIVSLANDNKLFGLWGILFNNDGDDFGFTHGSEVNLSGTNKKGYTFQLKGTSNTYTKHILFSQENFTDDKGTRHIAQLFTNEELLKLVIDNKATGRLLYWKVGAGWQRLDSQNYKSPLLGSGQQYRWHNVLQSVVGPDSAMDPINKSSPNTPIRDSFQIEAFLGLQKNLVFGGGSCRIKTYAEAGGQVSPIGSTYLKAEVGTYFFYQRPKSNFVFYAGSNASLTRSLTATTVEVNPEVGVQKGRASLALIYNQAFGELDNYAGYNTKFQPLDKYGDNSGPASIDPIMTIKLGFIIGRAHPPGP